MREFIRVASDIRGAEGPVFDHDGRFFCVQPWEGLILQVDLATGEKRVHAHTGGVPAGLQVDEENHLWAADMNLGILRVSPAGEVVRVVSEFDGRAIRGCNDCSLDTRGNLYFTAPAGSNRDTPVGEVFAKRADGRVTRLDGGYRFSNGIAVSADESQLIVAETGTKSLWSYDIIRPGQVSKKRLWAKLPGEFVGGPDGIDFDVEGNLLAASWGGGAVEVFNRDGQHVDRIETPFDQPSNLHFGGEDGRMLIITEHTNNAVWRTRWDVAGLRLARASWR